MSAFTLQPGDAVQYNRHAYRLRAAVSLTTVRIEDCGTGQTLVVPVTALEASDAHTSTSIGDDILHAPDIMQIAEADWAEAKRRAQILAPWPRCTYAHRPSYSKPLPRSGVPCDLFTPCCEPTALAEGP